MIVSREKSTIHKIREIQVDCKFQVLCEDFRSKFNKAIFFFFFLIFFCCSINCADLRGTAPAPLVPASPTSGHTQGSSASRPRPQRSTGGDVRSLVGCHPKETLHCCRVISVVFSSACSDSTCAGHHLLCLLLTTMLAKSRSQTE